MPKSKAASAAGGARPLRWGGAAYRGWTEFSVQTAADATHTAWLFDLNYQRLRGRTEAEVIAVLAGYQQAQRP